MTPSFDNTRPIPCTGCGYATTRRSVSSYSIVTVRCRWCGQSRSLEIAALGPLVRDRLAAVLAATRPEATE